MLNQRPYHNIKLTLIPNQTLKVTPHGKVLKKPKNPQGEIRTENQWHTRH